MKNKLLLDFSKFYSWAVLAICLYSLVLAPEEAWSTSVVMIKFGLILGFLYGNVKLKSWAMFGGIMTLLGAVAGLNDIDALVLMDLVGSSAIVYYIYKFSK